MVEERKGPSRINQQWQIPDFNQYDGDNIDDLSDSSSEELIPQGEPYYQDKPEISKNDDEVDLLKIKQKSIDSQDTQVLRNLNENYVVRNYQQTQQSNQEQSHYYKIRKSHPNRISQQKIIDLKQHDQAPILNEDKSQQSLESLEFDVIIHDKCEIFKEIIYFNQSRLMDETEHVLSRSQSSIGNAQNDAEDQYEEESFDFEDEQNQIDRNLNIESSSQNNSKSYDLIKCLQRFQDMHTKIKRRPSRKIIVDKQSMLNQLEHQYSSQSDLLLQMRKFNVKLLEYPIMLFKVYETLDIKTIVLDGELMRHIAGYDKQYHLRYIQLTLAQIKIFKNQVKSIYRPHPTIIIELDKVLCAKRIQEQTYSNDTKLSKYDMYQFEVLINFVKEDLSIQQSANKNLKKSITSNSCNAFTFKRGPIKAKNDFYEEQIANQDISINLAQIKISPKHKRYETRKSILKLIEAEEKVFQTPVKQKTSITQNSQKQQQLSATKTFRPKQTIKLDDVVLKPLVKDILNDNLLAKEMIDNVQEFIEIPKQIEANQKPIRSRSRSKSIDLPTSWSNKEAKLDQSMQRFIFACESDEEADRWVTIINSIKFLQQNLQPKKSE